MVRRECLKCILHAQPILLYIFQVHVCNDSVYSKLKIQLPTSHSSVTMKKFSNKIISNLFCFIFIKFF